MALSIDEVNESIANLLKQASANDLVQMLTDEKSILRLMHNNVNNSRDVDPNLIEKLSSSSTSDMNILDAGGSVTPALDNNINNIRSV